MGPPGPNQLPLLTPRPEGRRARVSLDASVGLPPLVRVDVADHLVPPTFQQPCTPGLHLARLFGPIIWKHSSARDSRLCLESRRATDVQAPLLPLLSGLGGQAPFELRGGFFTLGFFTVAGEAVRPWSLLSRKLSVLASIP